MAILLLITNIWAINWQGTGNLSQENTTVIWEYINPNFDLKWIRSTLTSSSDTKLVDFSKQLSDYLNLQWNEAWNVVVAYINDGTNFDTVFYGYAFRDHWLWYNGIQTNDFTYLTFIIWKDYNCAQWYSINSNLFVTSFPSSYADSNNIQSAMRSLRDSLVRDEVWKAAQAYVNTLQSDAMVASTVGADNAFSVIMSQASSSFYARVCAKGYIINYSFVGKTPSAWGSALVLQMR